MKKRSVIFILFCIVWGHITQPSMMPQAAEDQAAENLFSNMYAQIIEQLNSSSPDFDIIFEYDVTLQEIIHAKPDIIQAKTPEFEYITTLILEKAYAYVLGYVDQAYTIYAHAPLDDLPNMTNETRKALFGQAHTSVKKAVNLSTHIHSFLNELGDAAKKHRDHHKAHQQIVTRRVNELAHTINDYLWALLKLLPESPELPSFFQWLMDERRQLGKQLVAAKIISVHPLDGDFCIEMETCSEQLNEKYREIKNKKHRDLEKNNVNQYLEEALYFFGQIDQNRLSGNPSFDTVMQNTNEKINLFQQANHNLMRAIDTMTKSVAQPYRMSDKGNREQPYFTPASAKATEDRSKGRQEDQQLLEQTHSVLDEIFDKLKRFIDELNNTKHSCGINYAQQDITSNAFDPIWQLIKDTIDGTMSRMPNDIPQNYFAPLLQKIDDQLKLVIAQLDQSTLDQVLIETVKAEQPTETIEEAAQREYEIMQASIRRQATMEAIDAAAQQQREMADLEQIELIHTYITQAQQAFTASKEFVTAYEYKQKFLDGVDFVKKAIEAIPNYHEPKQHWLLQEDFDLLLTNVDNLLINLASTLAPKITEEHLKAFNTMTEQWEKFVDQLNNMFDLEYCNSYKKLRNQLGKELAETLGG